MLAVALAFSLGGSAGFLLGCWWYALWSGPRSPRSRSRQGLRATKPSLDYRG
jgi:cbb3-type cytochrome oxidase subunit 3